MALFVEDTSGNLAGGAGNYKRDETEEKNDEQRQFGSHHRSYHVMEGWILVGYQTGNRIAWKNRTKCRATPGVPTFLDPFMQKNNSSGQKP
jgi:hypothetical protein